MDFKEILEQKNKLVTEIYFDLQKRAIELYGINAVVLIEIGSFYEIYQSNEIGLAEEIANSLNIMLTRKNKNIKEISERNPSLCGIPVISMDKHLDKLIQENKWTIIIVNQKGEAPNISREVSKILSPGTNVDYIKNENYNFIASVYNEKTKDNIIYSGLSLIEVTTGKVLVYENYGTKEDKQLSLDEIKNILKINNCSELICSFEGFSESEENKILEDIKPKDISCHKRSFNEVKNLLKINFQNELLKEAFSVESFLSAIEELDLERTPNALNSLIILIDFISDHNIRLVKKLTKPEFLNNNKYLYIGNNALEQLNIVNSQNPKESLSHLINNGVTAIGKRFIFDQLTNPIVNKKEIENRYFVSNQFDNMEMIMELRKELRGIYDIERLWRKVELNTLAPFELFNIYQSLKSILELKNIINSERLISYLPLKNNDFESIENFLKEIESYFELNKIECFNLVNINSSFIKQGLFEEIDKLNKEVLIAYSNINHVAYMINKLIEETGTDDLNFFNNPKDFKLPYVSIGFNETEGFYFEITKKRLELIQDTYSNEFEVIAGEFEIKKLKNSVKIYFKKIEQKSLELIALENNLIKLNKDKFKEYIESIKLESFDQIILFISKLEFFMNNVLLKNKFAYCKPEIIDLEENFVEAIDLRHAIIEQININETYIPNDLILGKKEYVTNKTFVEEIYQGKDNVNGLLLYGLNSSGKSSYTKSLGIAIVLAQAGFFVPAKFFKFSLFESIFTRITGSDNIYKGLSTFAIEMLEMKNIFNRANKKTLILGDEIAHGTETISALSIVSSAVNFLAEKGSSFIFATHLHQLKDIEEVYEYGNVINTHLEVMYEEETESLIYNRKIKPGQGSSIYGLEFAKYMQMNNSFLKKAYNIRKRLSENLDSIEMITTNKRSRYNKDKIIKNCEICGEKATEEHHILEQHTSNENGLINHIHKNHNKNLVDLCEECHKKVHKNVILIEGWKTTSKGSKLIFKKLEN